MSLGVSTGYDAVEVFVVWLVRLVRLNEIFGGQILEISKEKKITMSVRERPIWVVSPIDWT